MSKTNDERIRYLDIAKGICLVLVMISHSCGVPFGLGEYFTAFYIQCFFILSGLTYKEGRTFGDNIKKRIRGIIVPYVIYNSILLIVHLFLRNIKTIKEVCVAIIGMIYSRFCLYPLDSTGENTRFFRVGNSPLWFLTAMFVSSCVFYIIMKYIIEYKNRILPICLCSIALVGLTIVLERLPILLPWSIDTAFLGAFFMLIGYYAKDIFLSRKNWKILLPMLVIYVICCYFNKGINISIREYGSHGIISVIATCVIGISGSLLCICFSREIEHIPVICDILEYIGKNTIMLLALHVTIFSIFNEILKSCFILEYENKVVYYGIGAVRIAVTVGICFCISSMKRKWKQRITCNVEKIYWDRKKR